MSYQYDAFFSYKRDRQSDAWHQHVKDKIEFWLKNELGDDNVNIFLDTEEIHTGQRWHQQLSTALKTSKCLICIWSPRYFQSKYCVSEWKTFEAREANNRSVLIVPASYHDGESFPQDAKAKQCRKFNDFAITMEAFWSTTKAVDFEDNLLKPFAKEVARAIHSAPPYDDQFPIVEAADNEIQPAPMIGRPANA